MRATIRSRAHPSTLAGATLLGAILLALLFAAALPDADGPRTAASSPTPTPEGEANLATAVWTSNVRDAPRPDATVVAVLPVDREVALVGRAGNGAWLLVAYPPGGTEGWLAAERLDVDDARIEALPEVAPPAPEAPPEGDGSGLPDLAISEIYVVVGNRLAFRLQNAGEGPLVEVALGLALTVPGAEEPTALSVDVAALEPGGTAAVVTPIVLAEGGDVSIELDPDAAIEEADEANNALTANINLAEPAQ